MKDNLNTDRDMVKEYIELTNNDFKAYFKKVILEQENTIIKMAIYSKVNLLIKILKMVEENIYIKMEKFIKVNIKTAIELEKGLYIILMEILFRDIA